MTSHAAGLMPVLLPIFDGAVLILTTTSIAALLAGSALLHWLRD